MALKEEVLVKIKEEITTDPEGRGYAGKTDAEIKDLLNSPYEKTIQQPIRLEFPARINKILVGIAETPNVVAESDVIEAKTK